MTRPTSDRDRERAAAYSRALRKLAAIHRDDFLALYQAELGAES